MALFQNAGRIAGLAVVAALSCAAQTYTVSSCKNGVSLTVRIINYVQTPVSMPVNGGHASTYIFFADFILTVNGSTTTYSSVLGGGALGYTPNIGNLTDLLIQSEDPNIPIVMNLQGPGDLIPAGVPPQVLPAISNWSNVNTTYIEYGRPSVFADIDTIGACSSGGGGGGGGGGAPTPVITNVITASAYGGFSTIADGSWIEIYGTDLAPDTRQWATTDFNGPNAPTSLDGVQVTINGEKCFVGYISANPGQINVQVPADISPGQQQVVVINNGVSSAPYKVQLALAEPGLLAPAVFKLNGNQYVAALTSDFSTYILPTGAVSGVTSRPARPGETILLFGVGFGLVTPPTPAGTIVPASPSNHMILTPQFLFGSVPGQVTFDGLAPGFVGLYQFDVVVPQVPDNSLVPLTFNLAGALNGAQTLYIPVHQ
jgi:uncharacterized protein (TIGR03437 family)